jgi:hypothetical protein
MPGAHQLATIAKFAVAKIGSSKVCAMKRAAPHDCVSGATKPPPL